MVHGKPPRVWPSMRNVVGLPCQRRSRYRHPRSQAALRISRIVRRCLLVSNAYSPRNRLRKAVKKNNDDHERRKCIHRLNMDTLADYAVSQNNPPKSRIRQGSLGTVNVSMEMILACRKPAARVYNSGLLQNEERDLAVSKEIANEA